MGSILAKPDISKVVERHGHHHLSAAVCSINGYRMNMEDAHCMYTARPDIGNSHSTFGIFDGHINDSCARYVAHAMPRAVERLPRPLCKTSLEGTFIDIDNGYLEDDHDGGTTGTVAIIEPLSAATFSCTICNVGDSRTIVIRKGDIVFATRDHKPTDALEQARIEAAGGRVELERVNGDLAMSRAFGDGRFKMGGLGADKEMVTCIPDITTLELIPDDIVLLCCDGVFEAGWTNEEVATFVHRSFMDPNASPDVAVVAARVCDEAVRRGSKDNISCMIIRMCAFGVEALQRYGLRSYVPGPPPLVRSDKPGRDVYEKMAQAAGWTVTQALQRRYEMVVNKTALLAPRFSDLEARGFDLMSEQEILAEQQFFGAGPPLEANDEQRQRWFELLWRTEEEARADAANATRDLKGNRGGGTGARGDIGGGEVVFLSNTNFARGGAGGGSHGAAAADDDIFKDF